jgi:hypothetical protein
VLDQTTWEERYGYHTADLQYADFRIDAIPAVGPAMPPPSTCDDFPSR